MKDYNEQIPDYLARKLSNADRDAFEMALLEDGELQSAVMIEQALKQGLGNLDHKVTSKVPSAEVLNVKALDVNAATPAPKRVSPIVRLAVAASLVLGVSLYLSALWEPGREITSVDSIVYIEPMRSTNSQSYTIAAGATTLLSVAVSDPRAREVTLTIRGNGYDAPGQPLVVSRDGLVNVVVPELAPGAYELSLKNDLFEDVYSLAMQ